MLFKRVLYADGVEYRLEPASLSPPHLTEKLLLLKMEELNRQFSSAKIITRPLH